MDKYNRVVQGLQEMIEIAKQAGNKPILLESKIEYKRLVKKLQHVLSEVRLCHFDYENADSLVNE